MPSQSIVMRRRFPMSGWTLFWIVLVLLIVFVVLANLRDIKRYIKIRLM